MWIYEAMIFRQKNLLDKINPVARVSGINLSGNRDRD